MIEKKEPSEEKCIKGEKKRKHSTIRKMNRETNICWLLFIAIHNNPWIHYNPWWTDTKQTKQRRGKKEHRVSVFHNGYQKKTTARFLARYIIVLYGCVCVCVSFFSFWLLILPNEGHRWTPSTTNNRPSPFGNAVIFPFGDPLQVIPRHKKVVALISFFPVVVVVVLILLVLVLVLVIGTNSRIIIPSIHDTFSITTTIPHNFNLTTIHIFTRSGVGQWQ